MLKSSPSCPNDRDTREKLRRYITSIHEEGDTKHIWELIRDPSPPRLVFAANPYRLHERLTIQKGSEPGRWFKCNFELRLPGRTRLSI